MMRKLSIVLLLLSALAIGCDPTPPLGTFERNEAIPNQAWSASFQPVIKFEVKDTLANYHLYVVIRHTEKYAYNNIWMQVGIQEPGDSTFKKQQLDLTLATNEKGWLGTGMDDIYEQRVRITKTPVPFKRAGIYQFSLAHIMREEPLLHVMDVGIRIEKQK